MSFSKTSIRLNLGASSAFAVVVLILVCGGFLYGSTRQQEVIQEIEARDLARTEQVGALVRQISENQRMLSETLTAAAAQKLDEEGVFHRGRNAIDFVRTAEDRFAGLRPLFAEGDDLVEIFGVTLREFTTYRTTVIDVVEISTVDVGLAAQQMLKATASYVRLVEDISEAVDLSNAQTLDDMSRMRSREERDTKYMLAGSVAAVAALVFVSLICYFRMQRAETGRQRSEELQKELEAQLQHSQRLEALGMLAGGIAHDLNNTLVPILALSKLAAKALREADPLHRDLTTIAKAGEHARDLVRQILAFSRKQELVKAPTDLRVVAHETMQMMRASLPTTVRLVEDLAAVPPILADASQLQQVIVNLVTNAAHAIGARAGIITVRLSLLARQAVPAGPLVELTIADTGCGMDERTVKRIFEPFYTTKEVGKGTGLGLSVVHGIITGHGGRIDVRSTPGEGTVFTIELKAMNEEECSPHAQAVTA